MIHISLKYLCLFAILSISFICCASAQPWPPFGTKIWDAIPIPNAEDIKFMEGSIYNMPYEMDEKYLLNIEVEHYRIPLARKS